MNEKIKQLAQRAGVIALSENGIAPPLEKFAELIIEECSEIARRTILSGSGVDPNIFTGTVTTVQQIKQHFGVEE